MMPVHLKTCLFLAAALCAPATAQPPNLVRDINPDAPSSSVGVPVAFGDGLLFRADDGTHGLELWFSDGTEEGTVMLGDNEPDGPHTPHDLFVVDGIVYYGGRDADGDELWRTDGTEGGTFQVKDINPAVGFSIPGPFEWVDGVLYFGASEDDPGQDDTEGNRELWRSDGTPGGTQRVLDIHSSGSSSPSHFAVLGNLLLFAANDDDGDRGIWKSDGTPGGTVKVSDINTTGSDDVSNLIAFNDEVFFTARGEAGDHELYKTDGTDPGTVRVRNINPAGDASPAELTVYDGALYFTATTDAEGPELWKTDGTEGGTVLVKDIRPGPGSGSFPQDLTVSGNALFFTAIDATTGRELWKTDGTEAGTQRVRDIDESGSSDPAELTDFQGTLYFSANDGSTGHELWKSDGTEEGTVLIGDLQPGPSGSIPLHLTATPGRLFLSLDEGGGLGRELYAIGGHPPRLSNIATRGRVGTGDQVMIAGFIIEGGSKRVIVRAKGPSLGAFGLTNTLNDPTLAIFSGATQIAFNDNWQDAQETDIQDSGFAPDDSREAAIIIELEEGPYTAIVAGGTGNAIVEVFELD